MGTVLKFGSKPRIVLLNVPRQFIVSRYGISHQVPLGLVLVGGPLVDIGCDVKLIDADAACMSEREILEEIGAFGADIVMVGHTATTAAHPTVVRISRLIKESFPRVMIVYGGVYPTFAHRAIMRQTPEIDIIVRGEGEATAVDLIRTIADGEDLATVSGIVWRDGARLVVNKNRLPISNLDAYRPGWELVDWNLYHLFGLRAAAGIQFGRGCIYRCTYCGQWRFWKTYRHRSPKDFVDQLQLLKEAYGVRAILPADEHFAADRHTTELLLNELIDRDLRLPLYINITVKDVLRDTDILDRYRQAGIVFAALGVESDSERVQRTINKNNAFDESRRAVGLLRKNGIMPVIQMIYGLEDETLSTMWRKYRSIVKIDPDFANLEYITPHFWTPMGRTARTEQVIQLDQSKWGYRNQVLEVPSMSPKKLFFGVKLTELLLHSRPKVVLRALFQRRQFIQAFRIKGLWNVAKVWWMEIIEFMRDTTFVAPGNAADAPELIELLLNKPAALEEKEKAIAIAKHAV